MREVAEVVVGLQEEAEAHRVAEEAHREGEEVLRVEGAEEELHLVQEDLC